MLRGHHGVPHPGVCRRAPRPRIVIGRGRTRRSSAGSPRLLMRSTLFTHSPRPGMAYRPQWMNIPKRSRRNHSVRCHRASRSRGCVLMVTFSACVSPACVIVRRMLHDTAGIHSSAASEGRHGGSHHAVPGHAERPGGQGRALRRHSRRGRSGGVRAGLLQGRAPTNWPCWTSPPRSRAARTMLDVVQTRGRGHHRAVHRGRRDLRTWRRRRPCWRPGPTRSRPAAPPSASRRSSPRWSRSSAPRR